MVSLFAACSPVTQPAPPLTPTRAPGPTPAPAPGWDDLAPYRAALRPAYAGDLDAFAAGTQYRIALSIADDLVSYTGAETVHYVNRATVPLDVVYFRLFPNARSYGGVLSLDTLRAGGAAVSPTFELHGSALRVALSAPLAPGASLDFDLAWTTRVPTSTVTAGYNQFGLHEGVLSLPNAFPLVAVYDDEGWNVEDAPGIGDAVYSETALYDVTVDTPAAAVFAATGTCAATEHGARRTWRCAGGPVRDFALMLSTRLAVETTTLDDVTINSYYLPEHVTVGKRAATDARNAVRAYERAFGAYPFAELDVVETHTTAGGIEYPGLVVIAADIYDDRRYAEGVIAHEVAHQWWYSLVGNDQVDDPWLDESLAQYSTIVYDEDVYGKATVQQENLVDELFGTRYRRVEGTDQDLRADLPVAAYTGSQYGAIVYGKAALFFDALRARMGDAEFGAFLRDYFTHNRYGVAHDADLLAALRPHIDPAALDELLRRWITTPTP
jgi:hypothetical protein